MNNKTIPKQILYINNTLKTNNFDCFIVGGATRDDQLGFKPKDYDLVTDATPDQVELAFPDKVKKAGHNYGVSLLNVDDNIYELATMRQDFNYNDGRRPSAIIFTDSLEKDAKRRDFTVNALYYDFSNEDIIDPTGGRLDLAKRNLRSIGSPYSRIQEDKLRMLRAIRLSCTKGFDIQLDLFEAIQRNSHHISGISWERITQELMQMINPKGIGLLYATKLLDYILPEISRLMNCPQDPIYHPEGNAYIHTLKTLSEMHLMDPDPILALATLLHDVGKPDTLEFYIDEKGNERICNKSHETVGAEIAKTICERLRFSAKDTTRVVTIVENHMKMHWGKDMKKSTLVKLMRNEYFVDLVKLQHADSLGANNKSKSLHAFYKANSKKLKKHVVKPPLLSGKHLIEMGFKPGPDFTIMINEVRKAQDEGKITNLYKAKQFISNKYFHLLKGKSK